MLAARIQCECGSESSKSNWSHHVKSLKHKNWVKACLESNSFRTLIVDEEDEEDENETEHETNTESD
jgi:hypothetical protein